MVDHGFTVVIATHHEEFLRAAGEDVTLVHVTRDPEEGFTRARSLPLTTSTRLRELADDVGMHPATALSLHRAILFVEGPLDVAVLDEYGGPALDSAGVKLIPIHGMRNLDGLVTAEVVTSLGIKLGILTDATDTATMDERSNKKRSSEEKKVLRVLQIAKAQGLPVPTPFGVSEADLLFALPTAAIRQHYLGGGPLPEWDDLVGECRQALGKSPSDSVNWKKHAADRYGLPFDNEQGVRHIVRTLDLSGVKLPSIQVVLESIVTWATRQA